MKEYIIKKQKQIDWSCIERAYICEYPWGNDYTPTSYFQAVYTDDAIVVRMTCCEKEPKAVYTEHMEPVYKDSCLEFFAAYGKGGYINCEMNSIGTSLIAYGEGRGGRIPLKELCCDIPTVKAESSDDNWSVTVTVKYETLKKIYGDFNAASGYTFYGNAYKCGDDCAPPHYGMWNRAECERPDFHRPEFFGRFILE